MTLKVILDPRQAVVSLKCVCVCVCVCVHSMAKARGGFCDEVCVPWLKRALVSLKCACMSECVFKCTLEASAGVKVIK